LKQALRNLQETSIEYNILGKDNTEERGVFSVLAEAKIRSMGKGKSSQVRFEFPSTVLSAIKNPRIYVKLNLLMLRGFNSKHSLALYEFLADYLNLKSYRCRTEDFRSLMGIEAGQYEYFTMLRKRVLDVAVKEINEKSDVVVSYDVEREGRKYVAIVFKMSRQKDTLDEHNAEYEIREKLKSFGLNNNVIETLLENHDESYLWVNIAVVEEQYAKGKVKNVAGYLLQAFANDYSQQKQAVKAEKKALINSNLNNVRIPELLTPQFRPTDPPGENSR
jgi:plasmid replication initiation protein